MKKRANPCIHNYKKYRSNWSVLLEQAKTWKISALAYGAATIICICWITDWQAVCKYIPYYGSKYEPKHSDESTINS